MNSVQFVGYDGEHADNFIYKIDKSYDIYVILLIDSPSFINIDGIRKEYPAHTAIILSPEMAVTYGANGEPFKNDWLWLRSDEKFLEGFPELNRPFPVSEFEYLHYLFKLLTWETSSYVNTTREIHYSGERIPVYGRPDTMLMSNKDPEAIDEPGSAANKMVIEHLLQILFEKLNNEVRRSAIGLHANQLYSLRSRFERHPEHHWTVTEMAALLFMSEGHLQLLYKKQFGISCMDDLINIRLNKAAEYLCFTSYSVAEIAELCGYESHEHFSRQFKIHYGISPLKYRHGAQNSRTNSVPSDELSEI